jgi:chemotaxis protein CheX
MRAVKEIMKAEFINPFVTAGMQVLESVIKSAPDPGQLAVRSATFTTQQVSIVIGVTGAVEGHAVYGMPLVTAAKIAAAMTSTPIMTFDETAGSAIAELGTMVSGNAATLLSEAGYQCELTPPTLVRGADVEVSTSTPALVVPLYTDFGKVEINVALRESTGRPAPAAAPEPKPTSVPEPAPTSEPEAAPEPEPADRGPADNQPSDNAVTKPEEEQS